MNKTAIFTIAIYNVEYFKYTLPTIEMYADKIGCDFVKLDNKAIDFYDINYEKYYLIELLNKYERVLHLDADIIVTPNAGNMFELFPDKNKVYAFNENGNGIMDRDGYVEDVLTENLDWHKANGKYIYFNAGVVLISNIYKDVLNDFKTVKVNRSMGLSSQTLLNYFVAKNKVPFEDIGYSFNRMYFAVEDKNNERLKADLIHYAGPQECMNGNKLETIKNDYNYFYT